VNWHRGTVVNDRVTDCDTVKNKRQEYMRHMAFVPSSHEYFVSKGRPVRWLLGVPLKDTGIDMDIVDIRKHVRDKYPS
jgi:hypothetical protein